MNKFLLALKSRTNWTIAVMWLLTYGPVVGTWVPKQWKPLVDAVLSLLAFYFKVNPSQNYSA